MESKRVPLPPHVVVHREPGVPEAAGDPYRSPGAVRDDLLVEIAWRSGLRAGTVGFAVLWWVVLAVIYAGVMALDAPWYFALVLMVFAAAGFGIFYSILAQVFNRTRVALRGEVLTVHSGPLPWRGEVSIPAAGIEQLYVREGVAYEINEVPVPGYSVIALVRGAGEAVIVRNLPEADQARYLEWVIEDALRVVDRPVSGELPKPQ